MPYEPTLPVDRLWLLHSQVGVGAWAPRRSQGRSGLVSSSWHPASTLWEAAGDLSQSAVRLEE